jgi:alkylation response protein AidB-like acyl-CoA dehydrogenase
VLVTSIRWDDAPDGPQVVHCSIPFAAEGVSIVETWDTLGMRGTGSHTVVVDDVFVSDAAVALVRPADTWHPVWSTVLGAALPLIMSSYVGLTERAVERAVELAGRRAGATEACIDAVRLALDIGGGMAYARIGGIERRFRDVHGSLYHPLPTAKQEMFTGEHVL